MREFILLYEHKQQCVSGCAYIDMTSGNMVDTS
jgi:hypothetical protein